MKNARSWGAPSPGFWPTGQAENGALADFKVSSVLNRDANRKLDARIPLVAKVVPIIQIGNIDIVCEIPVVSPVFRPRVHNSEPKSLVFKLR